MSGADANDPDPEIDRINLRLARSFLDVVDETWRERGFNSRSEFIRHALRDAITHPEGAGFWKDLAISEADLDGDVIASEEMRSTYGHDDE
ncbi:ribbon-helix-helix domain-containing protein [Halococcoides cellulosivorans]|uniref:CopG family transcriptional regulator n=1 Tax=Halococcoides cellulosivorans TaxID=1679096 RepID=A0A2R4X2Z3_9EURY|nr:ribbon-helix-helix domain-containing protein [Halococcoides cellulosivorans]AWB28165.1 CopG family transcriptional regulator [Halococcoides cellulosivorans]